MIKQKKTKKKNVNVNQTVVVNIQKGKRNPRAKASAPPKGSGLVPTPFQMMSAPQIIPPQVGSAYHQAVYGARAPAIPSMGSVPGYYAGMMSPFNAPLHIASEVQQAQLRQANELAGQNVQRPSERVPVRSIERIPEPERMPPPVKPKPIRMSFYPGSYEELPFASSVSGISDRQPAMSSIPISFSKPSAPLSMEAPEPVSEAPEPASSSSESAPRRRPERGDEEPNYAHVVDWIDRQTAKQGNSPIGLTKDAFIQQVSAQVGRQFTIGNIKNKSFDEIKRRAKKFISDILDANR